MKVTYNSFKWLVSDINQPIILYFQPDELDIRAGGGMVQLNYKVTPQGELLIRKEFENPLKIMKGYR